MRADDKRRLRLWASSVPKSLKDAYRLSSVARIHNCSVSTVKTYIKQFGKDKQ